MMNSKSRQNAETILDAVFELLDEHHLYETIDEPIERAIASFAFDIKTPVTHDYFIEITIRFVRHIYQQGLFIRQRLSFSQARSETIALLEEGYESAYATGYYAAYLDSLNDIERVLTQISDHIKMVSRTRYSRWVCATRIDPSDWAAKCRIVEILIGRSSFLPPSITRCSPSQLTDHIPKLINVIISSERSVDNLLSIGIQTDSA